jgi:hypothetical protein
MHQGVCTGKWISNGPGNWFDFNKHWGFGTETNKSTLIICLSMKCSQLEMIIKFGINI